MCPVPVPVPMARPRYPAAHPVGALPHFGVLEVHVTGVYHLCWAGPDVNVGLEPAAEGGTEEVGLMAVVVVVVVMVMVWWTTLLGRGA